MPTSNNPLAPNPQTHLDTPRPPPDPPQEDISKPVPVGEPDDEGYIIQEEDPEFAPPKRP